MISRSSLFAPLLALGALASSLSAQEPPDRWKTEVELGLNAASGNSSFSIFRTGAKITLQQSEALKFEATGLVRYGKNEEEVISDDAKVTFRVDAWAEHKVAPFVFFDWSRDRIRKLDSQINAGAGADYRYWTGESGKASLSVAGLLDYRDFRLDPGATGPETESLGRWSVRSKLEMQISEGAKFEQATFYQPVWNDVGDYILDMTTSVTTALLGSLSLSVEHQYLRDSNPQPGVGPDDQKFSVLLKMEF